MNQKAFIIVTLALGALTAASGQITAQSAYERHTSSKRRYVGQLSRFDEDRQSNVLRHSSERFCAKEELTADELRVAQALSDHVVSLLHSNRENLKFGPLRPFYEVRAEITNTATYKILRKMPKGGLLHAHLTAIGRVDWIVSNALARPNCHVKWPADASQRRGQLKLFDPGQTPEAGYSRVADKVAEFEASTNSFADALRKAILFDEDNAGPGKDPWDEFDALRVLTGDFIRHRSIFTNYLLDAFETLWKDGVYFVEVRDGIGQLTGGGRPPGTQQEFLTELAAAVKMMRAQHTNFECRVIVADWRGSPNTAIVAKMRQALTFRDPKEPYGHLIAGFDLVGEENGNPAHTTQAKVREVHAFILRNPQCRGLIEKLIAADQDLPYFLHDGESAWADNDNLIDAITLGTPRIGHAFNLYRFPSLYGLIEEKGICLEICPISNQLLGLVSDLRTHPAAGYLNAGIQCTLSSDNPLFFGNDGLTFDFWEALVAWNLDLAALKKLARNSIEFSSLPPTAKNGLMKHWETQWQEFIAGFVSDLSQTQPQEK